MTVYSKSYNIFFGSKRPGPTRRKFFLKFGSAKNVIDIFTRPLSCMRVFMAALRRQWASLSLSLSLSFSLSYAFITFIIFLILCY